MNYEMFVSVSVNSDMIQDRFKKTLLSQNDKFKSGIKTEHF